MDHEVGIQAIRANTATQKVEFHQGILSKRKKGDHLLAGINPEI